MSVDGARLSVLAVGKGKAVIGKRGGAVQECDALGDNQGRHPDSPKKRVATSWRINGEYAILRFKKGEYGIHARARQLSRNSAGWEDTR